MNMLLATHAMRNSPLEVLTDRLNGRWALVFSHADDFTPNDLEVDRWLTLLQSRLATGRLLPLTLSAHPPAWCEALSLRERTIASPPSNALRITDLRTRVLLHAVSATPDRFVLVTDDQLRLRRTITYTPVARTPSLFDIISWVELMRERVMEAREDARVHCIRSRARNIEAVAQPRTTRSCQG